MEINFTDDDFEYIKKLIYSETGISLNNSKKPMVYSRLIRELRNNDLNNFRSYFELINSTQDKHQKFIDALTTNLTSFFRESHHFDFIKNTALQEIYNRKDSRIRIWSAGCSNGSEPYTLAMVLSENFPPYEADVKILATDISSTMLELASSGIYPQEDAEKIPSNLLNRYFLTKNNKIEASSSLKKLISFKSLNLMGKWPMKGKFQLILCRNVLIYFNKETQENLINRYHKYLETGGYLILGHSEHINNLENRFKMVGPTIYKKL